MANIEDFEKLDIRVGRIIDAKLFPEARKPAYRLTIDFGPETGVKTSSAQITDHYKLSDLSGKLVLAVVNLPPRQVGPFVSEVLTLGLPDETNKIKLVSPDGKVPLGARLY